jgi:EAL domain-containing protein (putative c-di-GMP-specific phosphodiesterase class I)
MEPSSCSTVSALPYLEHFPAPGGALQRVRLTRLPFRLGRDPSADLIVYHLRVSKFHAEIVRVEDDLWLKDLGSTNGTFVNGRRVHDCAALTNGDSIHLAEKEFRFVNEPAGEAESFGNLAATESALLTSIRSLIQESKDLRALLGSQLVTALFQPIVTLPDRRTVGYEGLGRGGHAKLPTGPGPLFAVAEKVNLAAPLSRAFRQVTLTEAARLPPPYALFLNMHPEELPDAALEETLADLPSTPLPGQQLVLEVHEGCSGNPHTLGRLQARLREMGIGLAFDDFGVGQTRLAALAQLQVDYVKLDRTLVQNLPHSATLRELVQALARVCAGQGTQMLAEGVETEEEAKVACDLGCTLGQGYLFGCPRPVEALVSTGCGVPSASESR